MWPVLVLALAALVYIAAHYGPMLICDWFLEPVNVKNKYKARWAIVTGGSSGIGREVSTHLASQGLNVVLVAKGDEFLAHHKRYLSQQFPTQQFRTIGVDLSQHDTDYMKVILDNTRDIDIQVIVANAGFLDMHEFAREGLDAQLANIECNVLAVVKITHHFLNHIKSLHRRGAIILTSSQTGMWPTPYAAIYSAGKAFLTSFGAAIHIEAADHDIDVLTVQPGYVETDLFQRLPDLMLLRALRAIGQRPTSIAKVIFSSLGRVSHRDTGVFTHLTRVIADILGIAVLTRAMNIAVSYLPDYRRYRRRRYR